MDKIQLQNCWRTLKILQRGLAPTKVAWSYSLTKRSAKKQIPQGQSKGQNVDLLPYQKPIICSEWAK